jgi:uncharacterized phiE125 gp8 family phage protein
MGLTLKVAPAAEPVTLAEAKLHCKVDGTEDDALITALIVAARQQAEHRTGRALITQQWEQTLDSFPEDSVDLPKPNLVSVQSVTYLDADGVRQTLAGTEYQVVTDELVGRLLPAYGKSWPSCRVQPGSVAINYTCGYGNASAVPESIKSWIKMAVGTLYAQREGIITGTIVAEVPRDFFAGLLDPFVVHRVV